jgi:hypothetical protein
MPQICDAYLKYFPPGLFWSGLGYVFDMIRFQNITQLWHPTTRKLFPHKPRSLVGQGRLLFLLWRMCGLAVIKQLSFSFGLIFHPS